ncbi:hypothetical protein [Blastococcus mobilis]|uniref:Uncharacterized protein n=1 Tax=Blastococcus mobilis TaxID=1938746 RepID=A0A239AK88_9ACTN|nr:hypothetical protein [Blastococcus mobilis]SNR95333.1 hypothetical protein SAMN06272737_1466 [Blastococcus mobilis]
MTGRRSSLGRLYLDLIRDGVGVDGCDADEHDRQVHRALVRSAMSAAQCGQQFDEWITLVRESISRLGQQARRRGGRQDRSDHDLNMLLLETWSTAEKRIAERPTMTAQDRADYIAAVRDFCADADTKITDTERAVLAAACDLAEQHGTIRPALPWRRLQERSGLSERATKSGLASLRVKGLLVLHRRGSASRDPSRRRANVFHLPAADTLAAHAGVPYTPRGLTYGTSQAQRQTYGTPTNHQNEPDEENTVVTLTIHAKDADTLATVLDTLRRQPAAVDVHPQGRPALRLVPGGRADDEPAQVGPAVGTEPPGTSHA